MWPRKGKTGPSARIPPDLEEALGQEAAECISADRAVAAILRGTGPSPSPARVVLEGQCSSSCAARGEAGCVAELASRLFLGREPGHNHTDLEREDLHFKKKELLIFFHQRIVSFSG